MVTWGLNEPIHMKCVVFMWHMMHVYECSHPPFRFLSVPQPQHFNLGARQKVELTWKSFFNFFKTPQTFRRLRFWGRAGCNSKTEIEWMPWKTKGTMLLWSTRGVPKAEGEEEGAGGPWITRICLLSGSVCKAGRTPKGGPPQSLWQGTLGSVTGNF